MKSKATIFISKCIFPGLILSLSACVVPIKYDASVPVEVPSGFDGKINDQTITLQLPELSISTQVQAYDWDGQYLLPPLGVWIEFDPKDGWIKLDPQDVTLKSDEGDALTAVSFLGPSDAWQSPRALAAGCGPRFYRSGIGISRIAVSQEWVMEANNSAGIYRPTFGPVHSVGKKCFMFWFDTDPMPNHNFTLLIGGITIDGKKVTVPEIYFHNGSLTTFRGIP